MLLLTFQKQRWSTSYRIHKIISTLLWWDHNIPSDTTSVSVGWGLSKTTFTILLVIVTILISCMLKLDDFPIKSLGAPCCYSRNYNSSLVRCNMITGSGVVSYCGLILSRGLIHYQTTTISMIFYLVLRTTGITLISSNCCSFLNDYIIGLGVIENWSSGFISCLRFQLLVVFLIEVRLHLRILRRGEKVNRDMTDDLVDMHGRKRLSIIFLTTQ